MAIYVIEEEKLEEFKIKERPTKAADTLYLKYYSLKPRNKIMRGIGGAALILQKLYGSNLENLINSFRDVFEFFHEDDTVKRDIVLLDKWLKGDFQGEIELEDPPKLARMLNSNTKNYKKRMIKRLMKILEKKDPNITEDEAWEYFKKNYNHRFGELVKGNKNYIDPSQIVKPQPSKIKTQNQPQQTTQTQKEPPKPKTTPDEDIDLLNQWLNNNLEGDLKFDNINKILKIIKIDKKYIIKKILEIRKKRNQPYKINSISDEIMIWNDFVQKFNKSAGGEYLTTQTQKEPPKPKTTPDEDILLLNQWFDNDLKGDLKFDNIKNVLNIIKSDKKYIIKKILEIRKKRKKPYKINSILDEIMIWDNFTKRFNKSAGGEYLTTKDYINNLKK